MSYVIYKEGVRSSLIFQEKNGIPSIGISGDSGAGKTTIANSLSSLFGRDRVTLIHGDDIHKWERHDVNWNRYTHLNPTGNWIYANYSQMKRLKMGVPVKRAAYRHSTGKFSEPVTIRPRDIIISEGLHTLFINESNSIYDLKAYVEPAPELRRLWKLKRDTSARGYKKRDVAKLLKRRESDSRKFIAPQKYYSDLLVSYMPEGKVQFGLSDPRLYLRAYVRNDIPIDRLVSALSENSALKIGVDFPDHRFQRLVIRGDAGADEMRKVLDSLEIDYESYEIDRNSVMGGMDGVVQLLFLYCLDKRLGRPKDNE